MDDEDWRARMTLSGEGIMRRLLDALGDGEVVREARSSAPAGAVISQDGEELFVYAATRADTEAARDALARVAAGHDVDVGSVALERWHPEEERWESASAPLPSSDEDHQRERAVLDAEERAESRTQPVPEWEVDVKLPSRSDAVAFSRQLADGGVPNRRTWSDVRVATETEDDAREVAARLRETAPAGSEVSGPLGSQAEVWARMHPASWLGGLGG